MTNEFEIRAQMRCDSSCLEEYIIKRDLELDLSWFDRFLDQVVFIEKHPNICNAVELCNIILPLFISFFAFSFSFLMSIVIEFIFSYASQNSLFLSFMFNVVGFVSIAFSFFVKLFDGICSVRVINRMKKLLMTI